MGKKVKERVISQNEYFARIGQGVPVGDCRVDMGNGEYAYALQEVVVVGVPFNKYGDKFFELLEVNVCVADNTRVDTQQRDLQMREIEKQRTFERRKKEVKEHLYKITKDYFSLKKAQSFPDQQLLKKIQASETLLLLAITNDDRPLSTGAFPFDLYIKETKLINEFVQIRSVTAKVYESSKHENSESEHSNIDWSFYIGTSMNAISELYYSKDLGTWMGKNLKFYDQGWGGNQYTGGKIKFANKIAKPFRLGSNLFGLYSAGSSIYNGFAGKIRPEEAILDTVFGSAALYSGFWGGWANLWYNLGKEFGPVTIYMRYKKKKEEKERNTSVVLEHMRKKGLLE